MLSLFARRSAVMTCRRAPMVWSRPMLAAAFSTRVTTEIEAVEDILKNLHWADLKDNVHTLRDLLLELKTNHAIHKPTPEMEQSISNEMKEIKKLFADPEGCKDEAGRRILELKKNVRSYLYEAPV